MPKLKIALSYVVLIILISSSALCADFYVDAEAGSDSNTGMSPDDAWLTISQALWSAFGSQRDPAMVHIAAGTYSASTNGETFPLDMRSYVSLIGAGAEASILDAEGAAYHVVYASVVRDVSIEGLTIRGGNATGVYQNGSGGGMFCDNVMDIAMRSCMVTGNVAVMGAGIVLGETSGLVEDCDFVSNSAQGNPGSDGIGVAGGVLCTLSDVQFENCSIRENQALAGTGAYASAMAAGVCVMDLAVRSRSDRGSFSAAEGATATLVGCSILNNACTGEYSLGGGIVCVAESIVSEPDIVDCTISGNSAWSGAGIYCDGSSPTMTNCDIAQNICTLSPYQTSWGGGVDIVGCSPTIRDCTVSDNSAWAGAGICCESGSAPLIEGCVIKDNIGQDDSDQDSYGAGLDCDNSSPTVRNCVFEGNSAEWGGAIECCDASTADISNCLLFDNSAYSGAGIYCYEASPTVSNCTLVENTARRGGGIARWSRTRPAVEAAFGLMIRAYPPLSIAFYGEMGRRSHLGESPRFWRAIAASRAATGARATSQMTRSLLPGRWATTTCRARPLGRARTARASTRGVIRRRRSGWMGSRPERTAGLTPA